MLWKVIPQFEGYEASETGVIRPVVPRYARTTNGLSPHANRDGYLHVCLRQAGRKKTILVHSLVASAFLGPRPVGMCVNHKDGNKGNPAVSNLEYVTPSQNNIHAFDSGLSKRTNTKLSEIEVGRIRDLCSLGMKNKDIADVYEVSVSTIHLIRHNKRWSEASGRKKA